MAYSKFKKPERGTVWTDGGKKVPALIRGEWNGFAVAEIAAKDAKRLLQDAEGQTTVTRRGGAIVVRIPEMDLTRTLPVRRGRVSLGDGWSLHWR